MEKKESKKAIATVPPIFFVEGAVGADIAGVSAEIEKLYPGAARADFSNAASMQETRDGALSFIAGAKGCPAAIVTNGPVNGLFSTAGTSKDKDSMARRIWNEAAKDYAPILVMVACSKREAEKRIGDGTKLDKYVATIEKYVSFYRDGLKTESGGKCFDTKIFISTTYESSDKIAKRLAKKARVAVKSRK